MDLRKVKKLIELVEESGIAELEVKSGDEAVRISMNGQGAVSQVQPSAAPAQAAPTAPAQAAAAAGPSAAAASSARGKTLNAPLAGTFYLASSPEAAPFVTVGDQVSRGQPVCIIESMKMMNTIEAEHEGVVQECLVANGDPVEAGQALFVVA